MSRGWTWKDILGIGNLTGDADPLWGNLSGENATKDATQAQLAALDKAFQAIQGYADKGVALQQPYTQNAGADFNKQRGLVQSGYYQQPYSQSFNPGQMQQTGFSFNPSQGGASFNQFQNKVNSFTPQGLPSQADFYTPPAPKMTMAPNPQAQQQVTPAGQAPSVTPDAGAQRAYQMTMQGMSQPQMMQTPGVSPQNTGLMGYNPQTGQGNPLEAAGIKPKDPRMPTIQDWFMMRMQNPWMRGASGPLEGGMPGRGSF